MASDILLFAKFGHPFTVQDYPKNVLDPIAIPYIIPRNWKPYFPV